MSGARAEPEVTSGGINRRSRPNAVMGKDGWNWIMGAELSIAVLSCAGDAIAFGGIGRSLPAINRLGARTERTFRFRQCQEVVQRALEKAGAEFIPEMAGVGEAKS